MFLKASGLFDRLCGDFPVHHRSNNSCSNRDILGTAVLAILLGKTRYVHIEAITSRPAYMSIMGRIVESGRRRTIHLTSTHAESGLIQRALDTVAAFFRWLGSIAEQLDEMTRWMLVVRCAFRRILLPDPALKPLLALK